MGKAKRIARQRQAEVDSYQLTSRQEQILMEGVHKAMLKQDEQYWLDMDAAVMMVLMQEYGFRRKRLLKFYDAFYRVHEQWRQWYEFEDSGEAKIFVAWRFLGEVGITREGLKQYGEALYQKYVKDGEKHEWMGHQTNRR